MTIEASTVYGLCCDSASCELRYSLRMAFDSDVTKWAREHRWHIVLEDGLYLRHYCPECAEKMGLKEKS